MAQGLVGVQPAVAEARKRGVRAAAARRHDRGAAARHLLLVVAVLGLLRRELGLGLDVHPPAGQARSQARVLALSPDRQRELVVGDYHRRLATVVVHEHLPNARG